MFHVTWNLVRQVLRHVCLHSCSQRLIIRLNQSKNLICYVCYAHNRYGYPMQSAMDVHTAGNVSFPYGWPRYEENIKVHEPWKKHNPIINAIRGVPCYMEPYTTNSEAHLLTLVPTTTCDKAISIKWSYLLHMLHPQSLWMSNARCDGCAHH